MNFKAAITAAALALAVPFGANAATTALSDTNIGSEILSPGSTATETYTVAPGTTWNVSDISFTANGKGVTAQSDILKVTITVDGSSFVVWSTGQGTTATGTLPGFTTSSVFTITYFYANTGANDVAVTTYFTADQVSAVPLPAGGLLLVSALAGGVTVLRRRKKA